MQKRLRSGLAAGLLAALLAACGGGDGSEGTHANQAPEVAAMVSGDVTATSSALVASLNGTVRLDGSASRDPDGNALTYRWTLRKQPAGGKAPASSTQAQLEWTPDVAGTYEYALQVSDGRASATQTVAVQVTNRAPVPSVSVSAAFTASAVTAVATSATVGAAVVLDAGGSKDPDGQAVTVSFTLLSKPAASTAALTVTGKTARFTADAVGTYQVKVRGVDPVGAAFETVYPFNVANRAPTAVVVSSVGNVTAEAGKATVAASVGYDVMLNATASDADGDALTKTWTLTSRPGGSTATLGSSAGNSTLLRPDRLGDYVVTFTAADAKGARSVHTTTVRVNNRRPTVSVGTNATPQSVPGAPDRLLPVGTTVTLRGDASSDADGDALTHAWSIVSRPAGSKAALSSTSAVSPTFTPDVEGRYQFRLRVTDRLGAFAEQTVALDFGTHAPVAVVERSNLTVLAGTAVALSAASSFDDDDDALTYAWTLDAQPAGSTATVASAAAADASFQPDLAGTYVLSVRVSDGRSSSRARVTVRALAQFRNAVALNFVPGLARYSVGLDRLVMAPAWGANVLRIVDPFAGSVRSVALPAAVKALSLSPDGLLAGVLYEGRFSLVDVGTAAVIKTFATGGAQTDAFVTNAGIVHLIGQTGGQWVEDPVATFNARTGARIVQKVPYGGAGFYGTQYGVLADRLDKVFFMPQGSSPSDINYFSFVPATHLVTTTGDSPYHGDYDMQTPLYLAGDQSLVFTSAGTYFDAATLRYAGRLTGVTSMLGFSHSSAAEEALVLQFTPGSDVYPYTPSYPAAYMRFTGPLLFQDADLALPLINEQQSYGLRIFHSAGGAHVMVVQTGSNVPLSSLARYYVAVR
ncbi:PKD domain-containing protein [Azohydromonas aeria]|uniref:PKD domain-containing protein n=1 Tax=Azohydromonas aeria TaxID=2590212 RepID=UPI0012FB5843|nr:PKD domain-containing protein [Azohydromonas aeria]